MKNISTIGMLVLTLILIAGCNSTGNVVKDVDTNDTGIVVNTGDKIEISLGEDNNKDFYCSSVKPSLNCSCNDEDKICYLGGSINYDDGAYITIEQIKNDVYDEQGNLKSSETKDIQIKRILPTPLYIINGKSVASDSIISGEPIFLENSKIGDKVKTTITKIKYGQVQGYDCNIVKESICSEEHFVVAVDKL